MKKRTKVSVPKRMKGGYAKPAPKPAPREGGRRSSKPVMSRGPR